MWLKAGKQRLATHSSFNSTLRSYNPVELWQFCISLSYAEIEEDDLKQ